ncbi:MAG: PASTA domain-containing protein [Dysosmobacter welbionis]
MWWDRPGRPLKIGWLTWASPSALWGTGTRSPTRPRRRRHRAGKCLHHPLPGAGEAGHPCTVPNVVGKSASEANKAITNAGLIMKVTGTTTASSGNVYAITQSLPAGTEVAAGTVVTVQFGDNSVLD